MEKYGLIIHYTNDASYYYHSDSNEFLGPCDIMKPELCSMVYNKVFKREQSNTVSKWSENLSCLMSQRLPCYHGGCTNISEFMLGIDMSCLLRGCKSHEHH